MKKSFQKRTPTVSKDNIIEKKPFGFCCNKRNLDPQTFYNKRPSPFKGSLTDVVVGSGGPSLKFRIQDVSRLPFPIQRIMSRTKGIPFLGNCKRCRKPLRWYLEDEIALARDILARERQYQYNFEISKNVEIAKRKETWRKDRKVKRKMMEKI
ncbi:uncharacterized protein LOC124949065 [Vespa velutina]|uniref:uncharacterized protein LOC124949065 n=1 Tax=Vespa velutina TaxID=202808 RepID=UPI001FB31875|nr:uncharacterized protein LOC124949065 [Vespa velutina]